MREELSLPRRIARVVFAAIGAIFLILVPLPLILDQDMRTVFVGHNWGNPVFRDLANALSVLCILGTGLLFLAWLVRKANVWGLLVCTFVNVVLLLGSSSGAKEVVLVPFLCISLICLFVEEWKLVIGLKKRTA